MNSKSVYDERLLIIQLKNGDATAFSILYDKYSAILFSFLQSLRMEQQDIEDIIQQTFVKLWEKRSQLDENLSLKSYLITIAKNDIYNRIKHQVIRKKHQDQIIYLQPRETTTGSNELKEILYKILDKLPEKRREVFELSRIKEYSNQEIAEKLGISKSTVENHINNSSSHIKRILKNLGFIFIFILFH